MEWKFGKKSLKIKQFHRRLFKNFHHYRHQHCCCYYCCHCCFYSGDGGGGGGRGGGGRSIHTVDCCLLFCILVYLVCCYCHRVCLSFEFFSRCHNIILVKGAFLSIKTLLSIKRPFLLMNNFSFYQ